MKHEVTSKDMPAVLADIREGRAAPIYLLHGDEFLFKSEFKKILAALVPEDKRSLNYELLDGSTTSAEEIIGRINTFPLFPGSKVVAVHGIQFFYSKENAGQILKKAKQAFEKQEQKKAARYFLDALGAVGLSLGEAKDGVLKELKQVVEDLGSGGEKELWFIGTLAYCIENDMVPSKSEGGDVLLHNAITAGFPEGNHMIVTAEAVDKRKKLYKTIKKNGIIVDCSISKGNKTADRRRQKTFFRSEMNQTFKVAGKTAMPGAFEALFEKTGSELRAFHQELEKLIAYVGKRTEVRPEDVERTAKKSKQDPIYELTNALSEKDLSNTLSLMQGLLAADFYPLQILSSIITQIRKLILAKDLADKVLKGRQKGGQDYRTFQSKILPKIQRHEENPLSQGVHPYVLYKSLGHADNYSLMELVQAMETCLWADVQLKTSGQSGKIILEKVVMDICRR